ncbi:MAG: carboxymuconolactone decarboxylase family protein [Planctomycetes bacterium]|nr:carboxymuconolactone decarboxylase family protein [Planctomycetota bacterium]
MDDDELVAAVKTDFRTANLDPEWREMLETCVLLNRTPWKVEAGHVQRLKELGFSDEAIHDAFQVVAYFAYINRIADGLGVDPEPEMPQKPPGWIRDR